MKKDVIHDENELRLKVLVFSEENRLKLSLIIFWDETKVGSI